MPDWPGAARLAWHRQAGLALPGRTVTGIPYATVTNSESDTLRRNRCRQRRPSVPGLHLEPWYTLIHT